MEEDVQQPHQRVGCVAVLTAALTVERWQLLLACFMAPQHIPVHPLHHLH